MDAKNQAPGQTFSSSKSCSCCVLFNGRADPGTSLNTSLSRSNSPSAILFLWKRRTCEHVARNLRSVKESSSSSEFSLAQNGTNHPGWSKKQRSRPEVSFISSILCSTFRRQWSHSLLFCDTTMIM